MNFEYNTVSFSAFTQWCRRAMGLALIGLTALLMACGGGGGSSSANTSSPTLSLTNSSLNLAPFYPSNPVFLLPTYTSGTAKITWIDGSGSTQTLSLDRSGTLVQVNPLVTTEYTLSVTYQDPSQVRTNLLTSTQKLTVTVTPVVTPPAVLDLAGEMISGRSDHAAVRIPDGRILVMGGTDGTNVLKLCEVYDPSTETWSATGPMTVARRGHTATLMANGKVLVTGGYDGKVALATAEVYDPSSGIWTATLNPMNSTRRFHTATLLDDGKVLIAGGVVGPLQTADPKTTELYNPTDGRFAIAADTPLMEEARQGHTATLLSNGKVLFVGNSGVNSAAAKLLTYDSTTPASSTWALAGTMANTRYNHSAVVLDDNTVLVTGGFGVDPKSAEIYAPTTDSWSSATGMTSARTLHTSTKLLDGRILVAGGYDGTKALNTIEIYTPASNSWTAPSDSKVLNTARAMHTSSLLSDGDVLFIGTYFQTSGAISKTTELWRY
jgi:hypothetical protein